MFYKSISGQDVFMCQVCLLPNGTIYQMLSLSVCYHHNISNVTKRLVLHSKHVLPLELNSYSDNSVIQFVSLDLAGF